MTQFYVVLSNLKYYASKALAYLPLHFQVASQDIDIVLPVGCLSLSVCNVAAHK